METSDSDSSSQWDFDSDDSLSSSSNEPDTSQNHYIEVSLSSDSSDTDHSYTDDSYEEYMYSICSIPNQSASENQHANESKPADKVPIPLLLLRSLSQNQPVFVFDTEDQPSSHLLCIPDELLEHIFAFLDLHSIAAACVTCKQLFAAISYHDSCIWHAILPNCPFVSMLRLSSLDSPKKKVLNGFNLVPLSLKEIQPRPGELCWFKKTSPDGRSYLLEICGSDCEALSWHQTIHTFQTSKPWPLNDPNFAIGYFEVAIVGVSPYYSAIGVGIAPECFPPFSCMVGWRPYSYAYHSDDGGKYYSRSSWATTFFKTKSGEPAKGKVGDTIGCGVIADTNELFFTWNGYLMDKCTLPTSNPPILFHPTVSLLGVGDAVVVNLGRKPFKFDLARFAVDVERCDNSKREKPNVNMIEL